MNDFSSDKIVIKNIKIKSTRINYVDSRFNSWVLLKEVEPLRVWRKDRFFSSRMFLAKCDCGTEKIVSLSNVKGGLSKCCGCIKPDNRTHGRTHDSVYNTYNAMMQRCFYKKGKTYKYYGGRGITVCKRWVKSFENFLADMGDKPTPSHSLDRIDSNGDYKPSNCRWATPKEQGRNTKRNVYYHIDGEKLTLRELSEKLGIKYSTLNTRVYFKKLPFSEIIKPVKSKYHE